jgi:hypothetical protein
MTEICGNLLHVMDLTSSLLLGDDVSPLALQGSATRVNVGQLGDAQVVQYAYH